MPRRRIFARRDDPLGCGPWARSAKRPELRGLGDAWRVAESALLADVAASPRRARRLAASFVRLARRSGEAEAIGRACRFAGSAFSLAGRNGESVAPYREAIRRLGGAARDGARIGLALSLVRLGRAAPALELCREARTDAEARGDRLLVAAATMNAGTVLHESGDPAAAEPQYRAARDGFASVGQPRHAARASDALANALVLLDRFDEALPGYDEAAAALAQVGLAREAAISQMNRGELLVALDRLGEADAELDAAERALRVAGDGPNAALARLDRGEVLLRAHLVPEARRMLRSAMRGTAGRVPPAEAVRGVLLLARAEIAAGEPASARRTLARRPPPGARPSAAEVAELRGRALAAEGQMGVARTLLERAARDAVRPTVRARCLAVASLCATDAGDDIAGRRLAVRAEKEAAALAIPGLRWSASAARFAAEDRAGRPWDATDALARALAALESVRAGLGPDAMRAALLRGSEAWFARAVRHTLDTSGPDAALALLERWRARSLVDLLGDADRALPPSDRAAALRARLALLERRRDGDRLPAALRGGVAVAPAGTETSGAGADGRRRSRASGRAVASRASAVALAPERRVVREIAAAERALREETERAPAAAVAPPPDLATFARALPAGVVVVSLFADSVDGMAFVVDRAGVRVVRGLADEAAVAASVEELHFRLGKFALGPEYATRHARRLAGETDAALTALAERTLAPIAGALRAASRVVFVPHGPWHRVPFGALPFDGAPLAACMPVSLAVSIAALAGCPAAATGPAAVVAVPDPLAPAISDEGRRVAALLPGARMLHGKEATAAALVGACASPPSVLHVAAHGRFREDAPAMSGIRLADGWFRACEARGLRLDGSLVVLSGCETGTARVEGVGEALGLVRSVLAAGARDVVVSLWHVDDTSTADLMAAFHTALRDGLAPDAALARAQTAAARAGLHPWRWAGFSCWTRSMASG